MGFHLRMRPEDAAGLLAACECAAGSEHANREQQRATQTAKDAAKQQRRLAATQAEPGTESFILLPPDAGPLIADGVDYTGKEPPNPWLDGERVATDEPGWRVVGRQRLTRTGAVR